MKNKNEAFEMLKLFFTEVENKFTMKVKRFRSDRGTEYDSSIFIEFCNSNDIIHENLLLIPLT